MPKKKTDALLESLAVHAATGGKPEEFAAAHDLGVRTVFEWLRLDQVRDLRREYQRRLSERLLGLHFKAGEAAIGVIFKNLQDENATTRERAAEYLLDRLRDVSAWVDLEREVELIKKRLDGQQQHRKAG